VRQLASIAEELDGLGVILRSATEPFDTGSPAGRMMLQMLGVFAEFEHATIVDRITSGIERRAKEGRWYSGRPPFGYTIHDGHLVPDPITAPTVRRIYRLYIEDRLGTIAIVHQLRAEHAPAPSVRTNPTYLGRIRWRDQDFASEHEPLIDQDTFDRARVILAERGEDASRRRGNRSDFLLSGVIRCGHCGRAYIGMSARGKGGTYQYYACTARQKYGPKACQGERVSREKLETAVLHQLTASTETDHSSETPSPLPGSKQNAGDRRSTNAAKPSPRRSPAANTQPLATSTLSRKDASPPSAASNDSLTHHSPRRPPRPTSRANLQRRGRAHPTAADLAAVADRLDKVLAQGEPEQTKALLRILIAELLVNSKTEIPVHLPHRHARGLRNVRKSGANPTQCEPLRTALRRADVARRGGIAKQTAATRPRR
jgi:site-specific DNA recombinase